MSKQAYLIANVEKAMRQLESVGLILRREDITFKWSKGRELKKSKKGALRGCCSYLTDERACTITLNNMFLANSRKKKYNNELLETIKHELVHYYCQEFFEDLPNASADMCPVFLGTIYWLREVKGIKIFGGGNMDSSFKLWHKGLCKNLKDCNTLARCKAILRLYYNILLNKMTDFECKQRQKIYDGKTVCTYSVDWYSPNRDYTIDNDTHAEITYLDMTKDVSKMDQDYSVPWYHIKVGVSFNAEDDYWDEEEGLFTMLDNEHIEEALMYDWAWQIEEPKYTILSDSILPEVRERNEKLA